MPPTSNRDLGRFAPSTKNTWAQRRDRALRDAAAQCLADPAASDEDVSAAMAVLERGSSSASLDGLSGTMPAWAIHELGRCLEGIQARLQGTTPADDDDHDDGE